MVPEKPENLWVVLTNKAPKTIISTTCTLSLKTEQDNPDSPEFIKFDTVTFQILDFTPSFLLSTGITPFFLHISGPKAKSLMVPCVKDLKPAAILDPSKNEYIMELSFPLSRDFSKITKIQLEMTSENELTIFATNLKNCVKEGAKKLGLKASSLTVKRCPMLVKCEGNVVFQPDSDEYEEEEEEEEDEEEEEEEEEHMRSGDKGYIDQECYADFSSGHSDVKEEEEEYYGIGSSQQKGIRGQSSPLHPRLLTDRAIEARGRAVAAGEGFTGASYGFELVYAPFQRDGQTVMKAHKAAYHLEEKPSTDTDMVLDSLLDLHIEPTSMAVQGHDSCVLLHGDSSGAASNVFELDVNKQAVVRTYEAKSRGRSLPIKSISNFSNDLRSTSESHSLFYGIGDHAMFTMDKRLADPMTRKSLKEFATISFTAIATSSDGHIVTGDKDGSVRFYSKTGTNALTKIDHPLGQPIISLSVSADNRYVCATCRSMILFIHTEGLSGKNAFSNRLLNDDKQNSVILRLKSSDMAKIKTDYSSFFLPASFSYSHKGGECIISGICDYTVKWNVKEIIKKKMDVPYTLRHKKENLVATGQLVGGERVRIDVFKQDMELSDE
ncbi:Vacuolar import/degradation Vid27 like protein [Aduncisulcus paluster]|uniref:Vacuolar import/degradation Vid27 like protein n=1 Tax=Aduncisulcus paluster TaxID=2918883 RepID=A0ABQ5K050_9EUKA|nr:Vacuolar import/degradation Vid27 like protein [Aduncisulcus paluster]